jgi:hypothetical protein
MFYPLFILFRLFICVPLTLLYLLFCCALCSYSWLVRFETVQDLFVIIYPQTSSSRSYSSIYAGLVATFVKRETGETFIEVFAAVVQNDGKRVR